MSQETQSSTQTPKIVVVGAGISGISTAYYLQQQGHDVVLVEALNDVAEGATKVGIPLLQRYQTPLINYNVYDKIKSRWCPARAWTKSVQLADTYSHRAFSDAYGWDILKLAFDSQADTINLSKLATLTQTNYNETLDLIRSEAIPIDVANGHLFVGDDRPNMNSARENFKKYRMMFKDCDIFKLDKDGSSFLLPALQQDSIDFFGGLYTPSSLLLHPSNFAKALKNRIEKHNHHALSGASSDPALPVAGTVEFKFNTKAVGFTIDPETNIIKGINLQHQQLVEAPQPSLEQQSADLAATRHLQALQNEIDPNVIVDGVNAGRLPPQPSFIGTTEESIPVSDVVLCNGYQAFQITEDLDDQGPLLQIVPVRSISFDLFDKTRARLDKSVPTFFPTYPTTFYPKDEAFTQAIEQWQQEQGPDADLTEAQLAVRYGVHAGPSVDPLTVEEIGLQTRHEPVNLHGVTAVEFAQTGLTLVADPYNPRHMRGYMGKDMAEISNQITDRHVDSVMNVLEQVRKIPLGALHEVNFEKDSQSRPSADHHTRGSRHLSMQPASMGLHTIGRDGLPVIGPAPKFGNLWFNTGHGTSPHNTAIIGGKMVASLISGSHQQYYASAAETLENEALDSSTDATTTSPPGINVNALFGIRTSSPNVLNFSDFDPSRWPRRVFTPSWFDLSDDPKADANKAQELAQRREEKRQKILEARQNKTQQQQPSE